jgi:hypothetical protein
VTTGWAFWSLVQNAWDQTYYGFQGFFFSDFWDLYTYIMKYLQDETQFQTNLCLIYTICVFIHIDTHMQIWIWLYLELVLYKRCVPICVCVHLLNIILYTFFFFGGTGVWTKEMALAKQALYHLSQTSSSFLLWLFWRWNLLNYLAGLALNLDPPDLSLPNN